MNVPAGTITAANYSKTIVGVGTNFDSEWEGKFIRLVERNDWYEIDEVASTTSLTLKINYQGPTAAGQQYIIGHDTQFKRIDLLNEEDQNTKPRNRGKFVI